MYCDDEDFFGLDYWYKDIQQQHAEIETNQKRNNGSDFKSSNNFHGNR